MTKKVIIILLFILSLGISANAEYNEYQYDADENYDNYELLDKDTTYCSPPKTIKEKLKNAFIGQPTGFTPPIQPSPYLNPYYGPSYMQGYYTGNTWNSHNIYNPIGNARLFGVSF